MTGPGTRGRGTTQGLASGEVGPRSWAAGAHISGLSWIVGIPGLVGPLVIWLLKRGADPFVEEQSKEALNFQLSLFLYFLAVVALSAAGAAGLLSLDVVTELAILAAVLSLTFGLFALSMVALVLVVVAAYKVNQGHAWRYPATIRFVD